VGAFPLLKCLPVTPVAHLLREWFDNSKQVSRKVNFVLSHFYNAKLPATKIMLPKLLVLLQHCHDSGQTSNRWYFYLQEIIEAYYKAEGSCLFFDGSMEIYCGAEDFFKKEMSFVIDKFKVLNLS
jgi:hypothetical protein